MIDENHKFPEIGLVQSTAPGRHWHEVMNEILRDVTDALAIPADFMRLHDPNLSHEDRVLLELKIELHLGWELYPWQRNRPGSPRRRA